MPYNISLTMFSNISNSSRIKLLFGYGCWGALGFYRGTKDIDYTYKEKMNHYRERMVRYNKDKQNYPEIQIYEPKKPSKLWLTTFAFGLLGTCLYMYPITLPMYFVKECYLLEINFRGLDHEKEKSFYNTLSLF